MRKFKPKERLFIIAVGLISSLAFPPLHLFPLVIFGLWYAAAQARKADNWKKAFGVGAWFGGCLFVGAGSWVVVPLSFLDYPLMFLCLTAFTMLAVQVALMTGVATLAYWKKPYAVTFAAAWVAIEWIRCWLPTVVPWNMLGTVWGFSDIMIQPASVVGTYGLSFATVFIATLLVKPSRAKVSLAAGLAVIWIGFGAIRLADAVNVPVKDMRLRIVQPNFSVEERRADLSIKVDYFLSFSRLVRLSRKAGWENITHLIWPETALPGVFDEEGTIAAQMAKIVPANGYIISGMDTKEGDKMYNSVITMDTSGKIVDRYHKTMLVPFGEFMPLRSFFGKFMDIESMAPSEYYDFTPGDGLKTTKLENTPPFSATICFEMNLPKNVLDNNDRPAWIVNATNDGWYLKSFAPYQHLTAARMRAAEEGVPLVRATNTGISAVIDPYGRIVDKLPLLVEGIIDADLPAAAPPTIYNKFGNIATLVFIMAAAFASWAVSFIAGHKKRR